MCRTWPTVTLGFSMGTGLTTCRVSLRGNVYQVVFFAQPIFVCGFCFCFCLSHIFAHGVIFFLLGFLYRKRCAVYLGEQCAVCHACGSGVMLDILFVEETTRISVVCVKTFDAFPFVFAPLPEAHPEKSLYVYS